MNDRAASARILFVEDDPSGRELGSYNLRKAGYVVDAVASGEEALETFSPDKHDLVITDVRMPGLSGLDVLKEIKAKSKDVPVLVITAYGSVDTAVDAMKQGAYDFIGKPFNRDHLLLTVGRALESRRLRREVRTLRAAASGVERPIIAESPGMRRVLEVADRVADSDTTVLVTGETGTGKELIARRIHTHSPRSEGPFVAVNCAAVPGQLLESELFGHEKGAFSGAVKARTGRFRSAEGGTVFLDEVAEIPLDLQPKLLRVLQEHEVDVVGADRPVGVDVRVVAATNRNLAERAGSGEFRSDLLYRLNVLEIAVPALRDRPEDIEPLVRHFVSRFAGQREITVPDDLIDEMRSRSWPGNVRQLENACERLVLLCPGDTLRVTDLPPRPPANEITASLDEWPPLPDEGLNLIDLEKRVIERVLALKGGNVTHAAQYLGIPRHILAYRLSKYGIQRS